MKTSFIQQIGLNGIHSETYVTNSRGNIT